MSQQYESIVSRDRDGKGDLQVVTKIDLGFEERRLILTTSKNAFKPGFSTKARCVQFGAGFETFVMGVAGKGDFSQVVATCPDLRATEKALTTMHKLCLTKIDALIQQVRIYYGQAVTAHIAQ